MADITSTRVLHFSNLIVCSLSTSGLTLELARELPQHLKQLKRLYALDLSSKCRPTSRQLSGRTCKTWLPPFSQTMISCSFWTWAYLPPQQSLVEDPAMFEKFKVFDSRLGLGMDGTPCTGNIGIDYWILNARNLQDKCVRVLH